MATYGTGRYGTGTYGTPDTVSTRTPDTIASTAVIGSPYAEVFLRGTRGFPDAIGSTTVVRSPSSDLLAAVLPEPIGPLLVVRTPGASGPGVSRPNPDEFELLQPLVIPRGVVPIPREALPAVPEPLNAIPSGDGTFVSLSWSRVTATAVVYELEIDLGERILVNGTTFTHFGVAPGSPHAYRVAALTAGGRGPYTDLLQIVTSGITVLPARVASGALLGRPTAQQVGMLYATPTAIPSLSVVHIPGASPVKTVARPTMVGSTAVVRRPAADRAPLTAAPSAIETSTVVGLPRGVRTGNQDMIVTAGVAVRVAVGAPTAVLSRPRQDDGATYDLATYASTWAG